MPLILDGYNILFAIAHYAGTTVPEAIEEARGRLLGQLTRYAQITREEITVVFDQSRGSGGATRDEHRPGIRIHYSHPPRTADDDIRRLVQISHVPHTLRVVTSDGELGRDCARAGARVVGAKPFYRELVDLIRKARDEEKETFIKSQPPSDDEVRHWLEEFGEEEEP